MAKVEAKRCDGEDCGKIVLAEDAVEETVKLKGAGLPDGQYKRDLCSDCAASSVPEGATFTPAKKKDSSGGSTSGEAAPTL